MDRPIGRRRALVAAALALLAVATPLAGQAVTWSGQVRPRWELRDPAAGEAGTETLTSLRTRVAAAVARTPARPGASLSRVLQGPALAEIGRLSEDLGWGFLMLDAAF